MHFAFAIFFCVTHGRIAHLQRYTTPAFLLTAVALWSGAVADFANSIAAQAQAQPQPQAQPQAQPGTEDAGDSTDPDSLPWSRAGCALSVVNILLDLALLAISVLPLVLPAPPTGPPPPVPPELMGAERYAQAAMTRTGTLKTPMTAAPSYSSRGGMGTSTRGGRQTPWYPYDGRNRIDAIRRLCSLQQPDGHWERSEELAELVRAWDARAAGVDAVSPLEGSSGRDWKAEVRAETARAHACLRGLCETVWVARLQGTETTVLSLAERISLQAVNWDLGWAKSALERAADWQESTRCDLGLAAF